MKTDLDEIGYQYLFLDYVGYRSQQLLVMLDQATVGENGEDVTWGDTTFEDCRPITVKEGGPKYSVRFKEVHFYAVYEEFANSWKNDEIETEGVITKFRNSSLLQYVKEKTILFDVTPVEMEHYCVQTADDFIHVLSVGKPSVVRDDA
jgi:hypothetical protein